MNRFIKLSTSDNPDQFKRINYPNNLDKLYKSIREFAPINDPNKKYELIEENAEREIEDQEDFELMTKEYINKKSIKIRINIVDKNEKDLINDNSNINSNIDNNNNINKIKQEEENKYIIPREIKDNFRKKLEILGEEFLAEIEKNITKNNSNNKNDEDNKKIYCSKCKQEINE